jgi:hypothetical protein
MSSASGIVSGPDDPCIMLKLNRGRGGKDGPEQGVSDGSRVACMPRIIEVEHNVADTTTDAFGSRGYPAEINRRPADGGSSRHCVSVTTYGVRTYYYTAYHIWAGTEYSIHLRD